MKEDQVMVFTEFAVTFSVLSLFHTRPPRVGGYLADARDYIDRIES